MSAENGTGPRSKAEEPTDVERVQSLLADLAGGTLARLYVYRRDEDTNRWAYLSGIDPSDDPAEVLERIKKRWGGGVFKLQPYGTKEDGERGFIGGAQAVVQIAGRFKDPDAEPEESKSGRLEALLETMIVAQREAAEVRRDDATRAMLDHQARIFEAVMARPQAEGVGADKLLDVLMQGMEIGRETAPEPAAADPYTGTVGRLVDMMAGAVQTDAATPPPEPDPLPTVPTDPPGPAAEALKPHLGRLLDAARARFHPDDVAPAIAKQADPDTLRMVLADPTVIDDVVALQPAFARWRSWLSDLLGALEYYMNEGGSDVEESPTEPVSSGGGDPSS